MSTSSAAPRLVLDERPGPLSSGGPPGSPGRFLASELRLVLRRRRNVVMMALLAAVPVVVGVVLRIAGPPPTGAEGQGPGGGAPGFLTQVTENGLFLGFAALVLVTPFLLPLVLSVVAGESVAGEASTGTLRYLLTVPVARGRLLAVKYAVSVGFAAVAALVVVVVGLVVGSLLFPAGDVTLLSGSSAGLGETLGRAGLMATYATVSMAGLAAIGLFVSTLTEVPVGAMAATAAVPVVAQILGAIPQISAIHPWLFTDTWLSYGDFMRDPIAWETIQRGVLTQGGYVAVFVALAWARLTTKDVTS